jgi:hypothetical protein
MKFMQYKFDINTVCHDSRFLVKEEQQNGCDADRCTYVWETFYTPFYSEMDFWKNTDFKALNSGAVTYKDRRHEIEIMISGDALFNFKKGIKNKSSQKYEYFKKLLKQDPDYSDEDKTKFLNELDCCNLMFHSFHNFALCPRTGAMNNFKGSVVEKEGNHSLDRLDKFLFFLNEYYKNPCADRPIFSGANGKESKTKGRTAEENTAFIKNSLKRFLDSIGCVYNYCKYFYGITDVGFIERLIENGQRPIKSGKDVVNYMSLAQEFWAKRHEKIVEIIKK